MPSADKDEDKEGANASIPRMPCDYDKDSDGTRSIFVKVGTALNNLMLMRVGVCY